MLCKNTLTKTVTSLIFTCLCLILFNHANGEQNSKTDARSVHFDLPAQDLALSLVEFALQAKITIIAQSGLISAQHSSPLIGFYSINEALSLLLAKTDLDFDIVIDNTTFVLRRKPVQAQDPHYQAFKKQSQTPVIEELVVQGLELPFRYNTITSSQVHGNVSIFDTARFINVLPQALLADQAPNNLVDLLRSTSGITPGDGVADTNDDFFIRGFQRNATYIDGFRMEENTGVRIMPALIERVEVLKGPSTLHYGQAEPGGIVNVVRKKPKQDSQHQIAYSQGSDNRHQVEIDFTGGIIPNANSVLYRLVYAHNQLDTLRDLQELDRELGSGSLQWRPGNNTSVELSYDHLTSTHIRDQGTLILTPVGNEIDIVAIDRAARQKQAQIQSRYSLANLHISHHLNRTWHTSTSYFYQQEQRAGVRGSRNSLLTTNTLIEAEDLEPNDSLIIIDGIPIIIGIGTEIDGAENQLFSIATINSLYDENAETETQFWQFSLQGSPRLGRTTHHLSFGLQSYHQRIRESYVLEERKDIRSISVDDNDTTLTRDRISAIFDDDNVTGTLTERGQELDYIDYGIYAQNTIEWHNSWLTSLGARYTLTEGQRKDVTAGNEQDLKTFEELSTDIGLVYKPADPLSLYLNYSESMQANYQLDDVGTTVNKPELSEQVELGLKFFGFDKRLISSLSSYRIQKENIVSVNFIDGLRQASIDAEQTSLGLDWDFSYQHNRSLDIIGALSISKPEITTGPNKGKIPALASQKVASLFANYRFALKNNADISFNIGAYYVGKRYGDSKNTIELKDYTTVDFGTAYTLPFKTTLWRLKLNASNIFDERYTTATEGAIRTNQGAERAFIATVAVEFK